MGAAITDWTTFIRQRRADVTIEAAPGAALVEFGAARMHFETTDSWPSLSGCREWRGSVRMSALGHRGAADVEAAVVQFLILRAGYESPPPCSHTLGKPAPIRVPQARQRPPSP